MNVILATAGYDHTIRFWEPSGMCYRSIQYPDSVRQPTGDTPHTHTHTHTPTHTLTPATASERAGYLARQGASCGSREPERADV